MKYAYSFTRPRNLNRSESNNARYFASVVSLEVSRLVLLLAKVSLMHFNVNRMFTRRLKNMSEYLQSFFLVC